MTSFSDYVPGSATESYRQAVDKAAEIAEQQKRVVDPIHHEKIDRLLDTYARRLAENMNQGCATTARVPSILIAGGSNFPVRQKEKQNRAADANMAEWRQIQGLLDKIRSTGRGGISANDPEAVQKLKSKLAGLEQEQAKPVQEPAQESGSGWGFYIIADLKTWVDNAEDRSPLERFSSFEEAKARFDELRGEPYNSEAAEPSPDGQPPARLTLGLESADGMSAADILHVRQGENCLVTDFTRTERLRDDPSVMDILARTSREIGFDRVRVWEQAEDGRQVLSMVPFAEWDNPYFPSDTPGRFAARYHDFIHQCYPLQEDNGLRHVWIEQIVRYVQLEGKRATAQLTQAVAGLAAGFPDNAAVQASAAALIGELAQYDTPGRSEVRRQKPKHKEFQER